MRMPGWWVLPLRERTLAAALVAAVFAGVAGCSERVATQTIVNLRAEHGVLSAARTLRVHVENDEGAAVLDRDKAIDPSQDLLARIPVVPKGDDPTRRFSLLATLLDANGAPLAELRAGGGYRANELRELNLLFEDACRGRTDCGDGRTCQAGRCVGSCFEPGPAGNATFQTAACRECERCAGTCQSADGAPCGCPGETCSSGSCVPKVQVQTVAAGDVHTCAGLSDGTVRCWGSTMFSSGEGAGRLGDGAEGKDSPVPVIAVGATCGRAMVASGDFTCCLDPGARYCWGLNYKGELGGPLDAVVPTPHLFDDAFALESLASGFRHVCGLTLAGDLWCWGYNGSGNLGIGAVDDSHSTPTRVGADKSFAHVAAGGDHTCAVTHAGDMWCWGFNDSGEVGVPGAAQISSPVLTGCEPDPAGKGCFHDWIAVGAGAFHTCGVRESGDMYCWGGGQNGQLGIGPPTSSYQIVTPQAVIAPAGTRWRDVQGGRSHTCALTEGGTLYCWGLNDDRQTGIPDTDLVPIPTAVPADAPDGWRALGMGERHSCAIRADRTLYCWGDNREGQVGRGGATKEPVTRPARVCF